MIRVFKPAPGMRVEITHPNDPSKTVVSVFEPQNGSGKSAQNG